MGSILLLDDWKRQPPYRAEIDKSSLFSVGLCEAIYPQRGGMVPVNSPQIVGVSDGLAYKGNGSSSYFWKEYSGPLIATAGTILAVSHGDIGAVNSRLFAIGSSSNDTPFLAILADATTANLANGVIRSSSPISVLSSGSRIAFEAKRHLIVLTFGPAGVALYLDGILCSTSATVHDFSAFNLNRIAIGAQIRTTVSSYGSSACPLAAIWNRALSASEVTEISRNPWQIFQPIPRKIFVPVSASGATATLSGSEVTTSAGSLTAQIGAPIAGAFSITYAGALSPSLSVALAGNAATSAAGSLGVADVFAAALTGNSATTTAGSLSAAISLALMGNAATASAGALSVGGPIVVALTGNAATCYAGLLRASGASERSRLRQSSVFTRITQQRPVARITQQRLHVRVSDGH